MLISDWSSDVCSSDLDDDHGNKCQKRDGPGDRKPVQAPERSNGALQKRDIIVDRRLELPAPAADKKCAYIGFARIGAGGRSLLRQFACLPEIGRASWRERVCQYV